VSLAYNFTTPKAPQQNVLGFPYQLLKIALKIPICSGETGGVTFCIASESPLLALSSHQFHSKLKTFLFEQSFPP